MTSNDLSTCSGLRGRAKGQGILASELRTVELSVMRSAVAS